MIRPLAEFSGQPEACTGDGRKRQMAVVNSKLKRVRVGDTFVDCFSGILADTANLLADGGMTSSGAVIFILHRGLEWVKWV